MKYKKDLVIKIIFMSRHERGVASPPVFFRFCYQLTAISYELVYSLHFFDAWSLPRK